MLRITPHINVSICNTLSAGAGKTIFILSFSSIILASLVGLANHLATGQGLQSLDSEILEQESNDLSRPPRNTGSVLLVSLLVPQPPPVHQELLLRNMNLQQTEALTEPKEKS